MTDPYKLDRQSLADSIRYFVNKTGCSDFVLPDLIDGKTLAFGSPEFVNRAFQPKQRHGECHEDQDARLKAELADAQRMFELAKAEGDHLGATQFSARIRQCELNLARNN